MEVRVLPAQDCLEDSVKLWERDMASDLDQFRFTKSRSPSAARDRQSGGVILKFFRAPASRGAIVALAPGNQGRGGGGLNLRKNKKGRGAALVAYRSSSAFDRRHQRPTYRRIMARAGWKSLALVPHNLVVASVATVNPGALVTISASLHDFHFSGSACAEF